MDASSPPAWVRKRDGRLEPFDADKISRALFAASESLGRPDAFLARELTDGVAHFLTDEAGAAAPTTHQIAELAEKVVRELGQPALAAAFAEHGLRRDRNRPRADAPAAEVVRGHALQTVFARDLVAAQGDGLLTLTGLEAPCELAGCVLGPPIANLTADGISAALEGARQFAGDFVVLDGPEYLLYREGQAVERDVGAFARELALALHLTGLQAVVNLNGAAPPAWAGDLAEGPLFAGRRLPPTPEQLAPLADELARQLLRLEDAARRVRIDWHLSEHDFQPEKADRLARTARPALDGAALAFVLDRPRRPAPLAEGVDRQHPAVLLTVGVHLPRLAEQAGVDGDAARFLRKLASLARLALSAAVQKREFLRRQQHFLSGFLLDRARLVVAPVGLDAVVTAFTGRGMASGGAALDFGRQIVQTLRAVLRRDGGLSRLGTCLDGPDGFHFGAGQPTAVQAAGVTTWDRAASVKNQLRASGVLHAAADGGTAALFLPEGPSPTVGTATEWLRGAWKQSDVTRLRLPVRMKE